MSIFEKAVRSKLRFPSTKGPLTVEQLWDLPLSSGNKVSLDSLAIATSKELKALSEESFVVTKVNPAVTEIELKLDILKHIIKTKMQEADERRLAQSKSEEKRKLQGILARKQEAGLEELSEEELKKRIAEL